MKQVPESERCGINCVEKPTNTTVLRYSRGTISKAAAAVTACAKDTRNDQGTQIELCECVSFPLGLHWGFPSFQILLVSKQVLNYVFIYFYRTYLYSRQEKCLLGKGGSDVLSGACLQ